MYLEDSIKGFIETYLHILKQFFDYKSDLDNTKILDLNYVTPNQYNKLIYGVNNTYTPYPDNSLVYQLFQKQTVKTPNAKAVVFNNSFLTYKELDERSNQLASYLRKKGITSNHFVGIYTERSLEMVVAMIGVLKSGGAYVPIDTIHSTNKINYMLRNADVDFVLTTSELSCQLDDDFNIILLNDNEIFKETNTELDVVNKASDIVYLLYTSGSTGNPKAAVLFHNGVVNLLNWYSINFNMSPADKVLIFSSFSFDLTHKNIWGALVSGGTVYLSPYQNFDSLQINHLIVKHEITFFNCTPNAFYSIIEHRLFL